MKTEGNSLADSARPNHEVLRIYAATAISYRNRVNSPLFPIAAYRRFARGTAGASAMFAGLVVFSGCASYSRQGNAELFARSAPPVTTVASGTVVTAAECAAAEHEGDFVMQGAGDSMAPYFISGTAVVVHPTSYFMLRAGMPVVYLNRAGRPVAHMIVERNERGWIATGLNNPAPDDDVVTSKNLVGVIKYAFAADTGHVRSGGNFSFPGAQATGG